MYQWGNDEPLERVRIPWSGTDNNLAFSRLRAAPLIVLGFDATVRQPGLIATVFVDLQQNLGDRNALGEYFSDLARHWRGWHGERRLTVDSLHLRCSHDRIGHVHLLVGLFRYPWGDNDSWRVDRCRVVIEPGHLDQIAKDIRVFLRLEE